MLLKGGLLCLVERRRDYELQLTPFETDGLLLQSGAGTEIPERFDVDKEELSKSIKNFVRLKLARDLMLKRLDGLLKDSEITEEDAIALGRKAKKERFEKLKRMGYF